MHTDLAQRLREGTQALHTTTERAGIMPALLRGQLPLGRFLQLQRSLLLVYQALEAGLQAQAAHPVLAALPLAPLARSARLQADVLALAALAGTGQAAPPGPGDGGTDAAPSTAPNAATHAITPANTHANTGNDTPADKHAETPATALAYASRLRTLAQQQPVLLAAHAYVRYLGDLAGGQALARVARRAYQLPGDAGTQFFDFGPPDAVQAQAQALRGALDALPLDAAAVQAVVAEAQWAFAAHARLFEELAGA